MSTDAVAVVEILSEEALAALVSRHPLRVPYPWAKIELIRDYVLFDLLAGGRSGDPDDAVVPVRRMRWDGAVEDDPSSSWVTAGEVEHVAEVYREREGRECMQARALAAMMRALGDEQAVRVTLSFF